MCLLSLKSKMYAGQVSKGFSPKAVAVMVASALLVSACSTPIAASSAPPSFVASGDDGAPAPPMETERPIPNLSELGDFGLLANDIQANWNFQASSSSWQAVQDFNCDYPLYRPRIPAEAMSSLATVSDTNELAIAIWGASIVTGCPEAVMGSGLTESAFEALRPNQFDLPEEDFLNPRSRLSGLGEMGTAIAKLEEQFDFRSTEREWVEILNKNCNQLAEDSDYEYWSFDTKSDSGLFTSVREDSYLLTWAVAVVYMCPELFPKAASWDEEYATIIVRSSEERSAPGYGTAPSAWTVSGKQQLINLQSPRPSSGENPASGGSRVVCKDGWVSYSGGKQGACSWHGGVR